MTQNVFDSFQLTVVDLIVNSTLVAKAVLVILLIFSILSWAVMLNKWIVYKAARKEDDRFLSVFAKSDSLNNIYNACKEFRYSPIARIFIIGYHELYLFQELAKTEKGETKMKSKREASMTSRDLKGISIALDKAVNKEIEQMSHRLEFLATTGSTTPFIGLFGTVWGIMHSFRAIGVKGSASIGGVAPGIAEALIATAAGLLAAIPAVIFYNYLSNEVGLFATRMDDFSNYFIYRAEKNFLR
ncbi:MAG: protein TolQ [Nitrospinota bacterium]|nr:protein TolQ [Nitrospinota bacterium]